MDCIRADLVFGSPSELKAIANVFACDNAQEKFVKDYVCARSKICDLDRFGLKK